jgi:hypothetical protein
MTTCIGINGFGHIGRASGREQPSRPPARGGSVLVTDRLRLARPALADSGKLPLN